MEKKTMMELNEEENDILLFYRNLNRGRQEVFLRFLESLRELIQDDDDHNQQQM